MKRVSLTRLLLGCLVCLLVTASGCYLQIGNWPALEEYERTLKLSAPLQTGSTFAAQTHNGSITVNGTDVLECNLTATITARSYTEERAKELADRTRVELEPFPDKLVAKIDKPECRRNQSVKVDLEVTVPHRANLGLTTHNGAVTIADVNGHINGKTHNGRIAAERVSGTINLRTHNGSVTCEQLSGDAELRTHNGSVKALYSETAPPTCSTLIVTHNGSIELGTPPGLSATVEVSTYHGPITTKIPITVTGKVATGAFTGTIGTGEGKLHLRTHNGSIRIR